MKFLYTLAVFTTVVYAAAFGAPLDEEAVLAGKNIVQVAASDPRFSTLVTAVKAAGLVQTLEEAGPFTVFAPTNEAFGKIPSSILKRLLEPGNKPILVKILTYHVLPEKVLSSQLRAMQTVKTVEGGTVLIEKSGSKVTINSNTPEPANVVQADIMASNGVIHAIDSVLIPTAFDMFIMLIGDSESVLA